MVGEWKCDFPFATTSNMKVCLAVFQLKGSALLWWKTLLPLLNLEVEDVSWEMFEEQFWERTRASGSVKPTTMGYLGKAHWIHVEVNNCQAEHRLTVIEASGTIADHTLCIWIDPWATESFISGVAPKRIKVKVVEPDDFSFVEMASGDKQKVGRKVTGYSLNLGEFVTKALLSCSL
jgi:hypothetical protein